MVGNTSTTVLWEKITSFCSSKAITTSRVVLPLLLLGLSTPAETAESTSLAVTATVEGIIWSDTALLVPNRYATTEAINLFPEAGYRVVLDTVSHPEWRFDILVTGSTGGRASFNDNWWGFNTHTISRKDAVNGVLTVVKVDYGPYDYTGENL